MLIPKAVNQIPTTGQAARKKCKERELLKLAYWTKTFEIQNIKPLAGLVGLYFIFTTDCEIQYPFKKSKLLYIGMSEKKTNSIGSRLTGHFEGKSKNLGLATTAAVPADSAVHRVR